MTVGPEVVQTYEMFEFRMHRVNGDIETYSVSVDGLFPMSALAHLIAKRNLNLNDYNHVSFCYCASPLILSNEEARRLNENLPHELKYDQNNVVSHNQQQRWTTILVGDTEYVVDRNDFNTLIQNAESSNKIEQAEPPRKVNITFKG